MAVFEDVRKEDKRILLDEHVEQSANGELVPFKDEGTPVPYEWSEPLRVLSVLHLNPWFSQSVKSVKSVDPQSVPILLICANLLSQSVKSVDEY